MRFIKKGLILLIVIITLILKMNLSVFAASGDIKSYGEAKTGDKVEFGALFVAEDEQLNPTKPVRDSELGNIPKYSAPPLTIEIRQSTNVNYTIKWVKIVDLDKEKILYISDRNILSMVSWDDLNNQGLVNGNNVTIDGREYNLRLLDGGTGERNAGDLYSSGRTDNDISKGNNEWDKYIENEGNIAGLDYSDTVWNYKNCFSVTQKEYNNDSGKVVFRGYGDKDDIAGNGGFCGPDIKNIAYDVYGYRPVLEILNPAVITFENESTTLDSYKQVLENGDEITEPAVILHKAGYTFDGWYDGTNKWDFNSDTVSGSVVLEAKWIDNSPPPSTSTPAAVTFENEGTLIDEYKQVLEVGDKITEPADVLHKDGYTFDGWYSGINKWDFNTPVTESMVLKAKWIDNSPSKPPISDKINAHFYNNSEEDKVINMPEDSSYNIGEEISGNPKRNNYLFSGWYTAANGGKNVSAITKDIDNYYAHWTSISNTSNKSHNKKSNVKVELPEINLNENLNEVNNNKKYLLNKEILRCLKGNSDKTLILKRNGYAWTINGSDILKVDEAGYFDYSIDKMVYDNEKIDSLIKDKIDTSYNELQYIKIHVNENKIPVKASITYDVDNTYNNLNMYIYRYNKELNRLEIVEPNLKVKDNKVTFHVTYGGDYILVMKPLKNAWGSFWSEVGERQLQYIDNGAISIGFKKIENNNYYFNEKGIMQRGWTQINNKWYFMDEKGAMKTGWFMENNKWYYFNLNSCEMETGWIYVNCKWYLMDNNGVMKTGWIVYKNHWYFLDLYLGEMKIGWIQIQGKWYYLNYKNNQEIGIMETAWNLIGDNWYFLNDNGTLAINTSIDGYTVNSNGEWVN